MQQDYQQFYHSKCTLQWSFSTFLLHSSTSSLEFRTKITDSISSIAFSANTETTNLSTCFRALKHFQLFLKQFSMHSFSAYSACRSCWLLSGVRPVWLLQTGLPWAWKLICATTASLWVWYSSNTCETTTPTLNSFSHSTTCAFSCQWRLFSTTTT